MSKSSETGAEQAVPGGQAQMTDILDIKTVIDPGYGLKWWVWLLIGLAVVALIALVWWLLRQRKKSQKQAPPVPPHEAALAALDGLSDEKNITPRRFYFQLSGILRKYIEDRYGPKALEMTSEELIPVVDGLEIRQGMRDELKAFVALADPVKYAGKLASLEQRKKDLEMVRGFVDTTKKVLQDV